MKKRQKQASIHEAIRDLWKIRIMLEKGYSENCARWMTERMEGMLDHMQYGYALIAYHKQDGSFRLAKATLLPYERSFHKSYDIAQLRSTIVYWDVEQQAWRSFLLENFLEWRPIN